MSKETLQKYLELNVIILFIDGDVKKGKLGYTSLFCAENGFRKVGYFTLGDLDFKPSHVLKIKAIE